mmetsp:Transcript_54364/g.145171  ORF Transcript_54364/g.145171 Transcript_54364/m.145171 type:complete len:1239 (-) Transcript_54364:215-3931(-)
MRAAPAVLLLNPASVSAGTIRVGAIQNLAHNYGYIQGFRDFFVPHLNSQGGLRIDGDPDSPYMIEVVSYEMHLSSGDWEQKYDDIIGLAGAGKDMNGTDVGQFDAMIVGDSKVTHAAGLLERLQIPNLHCSGGDPRVFTAQTSHAFGMHRPYPFYSREVVRQASVRGLQTAVIIRNAVSRYWKVSGMAAREWVREFNMHAIGPTKAWCLKFANMTQTCRLVGEACRCGEQYEYDEYGWKVDAENDSSFYEIDEAVVNSVQGSFNLRGPIPDVGIIDFVAGIIADVRSQGGDPDLFVCWMENSRSAQIAAREARFSYKMAFNLPNTNTTSWTGYPTDSTSFSESLTSNDAMYNIGGGQYHYGMQYSDPIFGGNQNMVRMWTEKFGTPPGDHAAGCIAAGVTLAFSLGKYGSSLSNLSLAERRTMIRYAIGDMNDETVFGVVRFNRFGQNAGGLPVNWQVIEDGSSAPVLPEASAPSLLQLPAPTWGVRLGCPPGSFAYQGTDRLLPTQCLPCPAGTFRSTTSDAMTSSTCSLCPTGLGTLANESGMVTCHLCPAGHYQDARFHFGVCSMCEPGSARRADDPGDGCTPCSPGTYEVEPGQESCKVCPAQTKQPEAGQTFCTCTVGTYRDPLDPARAGSTMPCLSCQAALPGSSTRYPGASSVSDCGCSSGRYITNQSGVSRCVSCMEGLACPFGGSVEAMLAGTQHSVDGAPALMPGYFSFRAAPMEVYRCVPDTHCPGGPPETCRGGRTGLACVECESGFTWDGEKCAECAAGDTGAWVIVCIALVVVLAAAYYLLNSPVTAKASVMLATTCVAGMTVSTVQSLGIIGVVPVDWPEPLASIYEVMAVFLLDLEGMGVSCVAGGAASRYATSGLVFPAALAVLVGLSILSQFLPSRLSAWRWTRAKSLSTMGQFLQVGFTTMSNIALMPFMCYTHPMGDSSVLKYNSVLCGEGDHSVMVAVGLVLLAIGVAFVALLIVVVVVAPTKAASGKVEFLQATRFLLFRFRVDVWWYGLVLVARGPLLSIPAVAFTDSTAGQLLAMTLVLMVGLAVQLSVWPWKTPLVNLLDATINMFLILVLFVAALFVPQVVGTSSENTFTVVGMVFLCMLMSCVSVMLFVVAAALISRGPMGSSQEMSILTLGKLPDTTDLASKFQTLAKIATQMTDAGILELIEALAVYDLRDLASVVTCLGNKLGGDMAKSLRSTRRATPSVGISSRELSASLGHDRGQLGDSTPAFVEL